MRNKNEKKKKCIKIIGDIISLIFLAFGFLLILSMINFGFDVIAFIISVLYLFCGVFLFVTREAE